MPRKAASSPVAPRKRRVRPLPPYDPFWKRKRDRARARSAATKARPCNLTRRRTQTISLLGLGRVKFVVPPPLWWVKCGECGREQGLVGRLPDHCPRCGGGNWW